MHTQQEEALKTKPWTVWIATALFSSLIMAQGPKGHLVLNGGGKKPDVVMNKFIELAGGTDALILVIPTASELMDTGSFYRHLFEDPYGCTQVKPLEIHHRKQAERNSYVELVKQAGGIFFAGGDQRRITAALLNTPVGDAIREAYWRGACIGGTSAGTACMSQAMLTGEGDFDRIAADRVELVPGFGFFPRAILDQHFVARSRQNRLLSVILQNPNYLGIGVDEATAVWLKPSGVVEVLGEGWVQVYVPDPARVTRRHTEQGLTHLGVVGMTVHILQPGDQFNLTDHSVTLQHPSPVPKP